MNRLALYIQFTILLFAQLSFAQEQSTTDYIYTIKHYNVENGLSHNATYNITKNQNDNILVLTRVGLDMISFEKVNNIQNINPVFNDNIHAKIISNTPNSYTIVNPFHFFEINEEEFIHIDLKKKETSTFPFPIKQIRGWFPTEEQELFALNQDYSLLQFHAIDSAEIILNKIKFNEAFKSDFNYVKYIDNRWLYLVQTIQGIERKLHVVDLLKKEIKELAESAAIKEQLFPIKIWDKQAKHLHTHPDLTSFLDHELNFHSTKKQFGTTLYDPYSKLFWYIEDHVLHGFHPAQGLIHQVDLPKVFFNTNMIFTKDAIWLSSAFDGIYQVNIEEKKFKSLLTHKGGPRNIIQDQRKQIWLAGIGITDNNNDHKFLETNIKFDNTLLFLDRSGFIWTAPKYSDNILKYNDRLQVIQEFNLTLDSLKSRFWTMAEDQDGTVWLAGNEKIIGIQTNNEIEEINLAYPLPFLKYHIEIEGNEHFWLCTDRGLFLVHRPSGQIKYFGSYLDNRGSLPATAFHHMYLDKDSICWLATGNSGLLRWDRKIDLQKNPKNAVKIYDTSFGIPSNTMHAIYEDEYGFLWIASEYGIIQFHKQSEHFHSFLEEDGITNNEFNRSSHFRDEEGNIYFGGVKGLTKFHPKDFIADTTKSNVSVFSIQKFKDKRYSDYFKEFSSTGKINFDSSYDLFTLKFGTNNLAPGNTYRYFYSYDQETWLPNKTYSINISNLSPGEHNLHIKKENLVGDVLGQLSIPIQVPKPFYLKYWFFSLIILALIGIIYLLFKLQSEYYRVQKNNLESKVRERTRKIEQAKTLIEHQAKTLEHLQQKKSNLFKNIAHELRNPLTLIFGATKMLEKQVAKITDKKINKKYFNAITSSGGKILSLTDEVLFLAKLEANTEPIHLAPISLFLLLDKIIKQFKVIADFQQKELHFNYELSKDLVVQLDAVKTEKIITNLLSNAFKYSPKGAQIFLDIKRQQDQLIIKVEDTGFGIAEEELPLIFEPYYRSERITKIYDALEGTGGTGIGLSIVKKLASLLGGDIEVQSKTNEGTTFTFTSPLLIVSEEQQAKVIHKQTELSIDEDSRNLLVQKNQHILVVDDHPGVINFISDLLESNYLVSVASSGISAIEVIKEKCASKTVPMVSLIICDIMMPEMDGIQFVEQLKKHAKWKWIPIIFLSGYNDESTKRRALQFGVEDYLVKPFDPDELLARISHLLDHKRKHTSPKELEDFNITASFDSEWIARFSQLVQDNIDNLNLGIDFLADEMAISKRQMTRKIKQQTGLTPGKYVQEVRLQKARILLEEKTYFSISAVAYSVGFKSPKYFSRQFKKRFGRSPATYFE